MSSIKTNQSASGFRWYLFSEAKDESIIDTIKEGLWEAKIQFPEHAIIYNWDPFVSHLVRIRIESEDGIEGVKAVDKAVEHVIHKKCMYNGVKLISGELKTVTH